MERMVAVLDRLATSRHSSDPLWCAFREVRGRLRVRFCRQIVSVERMACWLNIAALFVCGPPSTG
jgi:hypothetical protein